VNLDEAIADANRPRLCPACGRLFVGAAAFTVHRDPVAGCLPDGAHGQLVEVDGAWMLAGPGTG
jgi:hypothetical protein